MVELDTRWTFEPGDRLSIMGAITERPSLVLHHVDASGEAGSQQGVRTDGR